MDWISLPTFWASVGISSLDELRCLSFREFRVIAGPPFSPAKPLPTEKDFFPASSSDDGPLSLRFPASSLSFLLSFSSSFWADGFDACCKTKLQNVCTDWFQEMISHYPTSSSHLTSFTPGVIFSSRRLSRLSMANIRLLSSFICNVKSTWTPRRWFCMTKRLHVS